MIISLKKLISFSVFLLLMSTIKAQVNAKDIPGKIMLDRNDASKQIDQFRPASKTRSTELKKLLATQVQVANQAPSLRPAIGFSVDLSCYVVPLRFPAGTMLANMNTAIVLHYMTKDVKTGVPKKSPDGAAIYFITNDLGFLCRGQGYFGEDCIKLGIDPFFEEFPMSDSTADYLEYNFTHYGFSTNNPDTVRVFRRYNKPLFIPFTRKEFVQYLIIKKNYEIKEEKAIVADQEKNIAETKKNLASRDYNQATKDVLIKTLPIQEAGLSKAKARQAELQIKLEHYQDVLKNMSPTDAALGARVDMNKTGSDFDYLATLVAPGRQEGDALYQMNKNYFDISPGAPPAQLMVLYYDWPNLAGFNNKLDYLQEKTMQVYRELDLHSLSVSLQ